MKQLRKVWVLLVLALPLLPQAQNINWSHDRILHWSDFKGPVDPNSNLTASTFCRIEYSYQYSGSELGVDVVVYFGPGKSWKRVDKPSDALLKHEEAHFDIAELYGRMLRKEFSAYTLNPTTVDGDLKAIFDGVWKKYRAKQAKYDSETNHGGITEEQARWEELIAKQLKETEEWSLTSLAAKEELIEEE